MNEQDNPRPVPDDTEQNRQDAQLNPNGTPRTTYEKLISKVGSVIDDLTTLQVTTCLGKVDPAQLRNVDSGLISNAKVIHSSIGLLDGDITTVIDEVFVPEAEIPKLRDFHEQRVTEGGDIVKRNIEAVKELLSMVESFRGEEEQEQE